MKRTALAFMALTVVATIAALISAQPPQRREGPPGQAGERPQPGPFHPLLRLFDADGDGTLSESEINAAPAKLRGLDRDDDGRLGAEELRAALPFGPGGAMPPAPGGPIPFGAEGPRRSPGERGPRAPRATEADFENPNLPKDDDERRILAVLEEMRKGPRFANVSDDDGRLLRLLAEATGAQRVVEIGTSTGESAVWFALALRTTGGHLFTHEIDPRRAKIAEENFQKAGVNDLVTVILGDAHESVKQHREPIDILFLDADKDGYVDYLDKLLPLVRPGGLVIAHNVNPRQADPAYLRAITQDPKLETSFLLMERSGVGVTLKKR